MFLHRSIKVRQANGDNKHYVTLQGSRDKFLNIDKHPICYQQQMFKTKKLEDMEAELPTDS